MVDTQGGAGRMDTWSPGSRKGAGLPAEWTQGEAWAQANILDWLDTKQLGAFLSTQHTIPNEKWVGLHLS